MPRKKNAAEISSYYQKKHVVQGYDERRFAGLGGRYINQQEVTPLIDLATATFKKKSRVLDIGAGRGRLSIPLQVAGFDVFCLDRSAEMIKYLSDFFPKKKLIHQSIFSSIKSEAKFDVITGLRFFDHFNLEDQAKILENLKKVLTKNGSLVVICLNRLSVEAVVSRFFPYGRYNFFYSDQEYRAMFASVGLKTVARKTSIFIPRGVFLVVANQPLLVGILKQIDQGLLRLFPGWGAVYYYQVMLDI